MPSLGYKFPLYGFTWGAREYVDVGLTLVLGAAGSSSPRAKLTTRLQESFDGCVTLFNSGSSALEVALKQISTRLPPSAPRGVAVPSLICQSVPERIVKAGLTPVFVDVEEDLSVSRQAVSSSLEQALVAVVFPYLYGRVTDIRPVRQYCDANGLVLIEDCAAALLLPPYQGLPVGLHGDYVIFSLSVGKALVSGAGGALLARTGLPASDADASFARSGLRERLLGLSKIRFVLEYRLKPLHWIMTRALGPLSPGPAPRVVDEVRGLAAVDVRLAWTQTLKWAEIYTRKCRVLERYARNLSGSGSVTLPQYRPGGYLNRLFVRFPCSILTRSENGLTESRAVAFLRSRGVETQLPYFPAHRRERFAQYAKGRYPVTDMLSASMIEVPSQPGLGDHQIDRVCEALLACAAACVT